VTTIASTPKGHNVKPPPGPAEPPARTTPSELTDEQRGWLSAASRSNIGGWLHITTKGSPERGYLKDRPQQPWAYIESGSTGGP
jgi:hypothetical protein